jgi:hypothetical protein
MMATDMDFFGKIVNDSIKELGFEPHMSTNEVVRHLSPCNKATSVEGIETCILLSSEDLSRAMHPRSGNFDKLLKKIDESVGTWHNMWYAEHKL